MEAIRTFRINSFERRRNILGGVLVGLSFFALSFLTVKFFAPQIETDATNQTSNSSVGNYTLSMSNDSNVDINITPSSSQSIYTGANNLSITNTCPAGATITLTTTSETSNSLTRAADPSDENLKDIVATTTTALDNNSWGYALNNTSTYYAVPKKGETAATIYDGSAAQSSALTIQLKYGLRVNNEVPSGIYKNDVVYTMTPKPGCAMYSVTWDFNGGEEKDGVTYPATITWGDTLDISQVVPVRKGYAFAGWSNGTTTFTGDDSTADVNPNSAQSVTLTAQWGPSLQDFLCSDLTVGQTTTLWDARDGKSYTVARLADGRCWMTQNLRLINATVSSEDTNLSTDATFTIPAQPADGKISSTTSAPKVLYSGNTTYGTYYNYYAATGGTVTSGVVDDSSIKYSICPKGWHLPINDEWTAMLNAYGAMRSNATSFGIVTQPPISLVLAGYGTGSISNAGTKGLWWMANTSNSNSMGRGITSPDAMNSSSIPRGYGASIRCIAKETLQGFDTSTLTTAGDTKTLVDSRDGEEYTVAKLADGRVWMTQNLRLRGYILNSRDSDVESDYEIPEVWTNAIDSPVSQYTGDREYGTYYNIIAATAGTSTDRTQPAATEVSICPKGWTLPTRKEWQNLFSASSIGNNAAGVEAAQQAPISLVLAGSRAVSSSVGKIGYYFTHDTATTVNFISVNSNSNSVTTGGNTTVTSGYSVRCIARETLQNFNASTFATGETRTLMDIRDGNKYTVAKLNDGKIWMSQNLRLVDRTLSSSDSNVASGELFTLPASAGSNFKNVTTISTPAIRDASDTASGDPMYGVYYNYAAGTAGTVTSSDTEDESVYSVCPKGWKIPSQADWAAMFSAHSITNSESGREIARQAPISLIYSGRHLIADEPSNLGSAGGWWTTTKKPNSNNRYTVSITASAIGTQNGNYANTTGQTIRCVTSN